jgi:uncharacterized repeat protein (TIGR04076 family)
MVKLPRTVYRISSIWRILMQRREFLTVVAAAAASDRPEVQAVAADQSQKKYGIKITVLKRSFEKELSDRFSGPKTACTRFSDGQEFTISSKWSMPAKFCEWAWADIRTYIPMVLGEGAATAACCTDGFRPVFFQIERVEL